MDGILRKLLSNDSDAVREATKELKEAVNNPESIEVLCKLLSSHPEVEIRQYATIILRKRFKKTHKWHAISPPDRANIKAGLLDTFIKEPERIVKNSIAQLIGTILKHDYPDWTELLNFLHQTMLSDVNDQKELGFYLLSILTEICDKELQEHAVSFCTLFSQILSGLGDKASPIGYFIMLCLTHLCPTISSGNQLIVNTYSELIPKTYDIVRALAEKRPDRAAEALDLYYDLATESDTMALLSPRLKPLVNLCLELTQNCKYEDLQIKALNFIAMIATIKVKNLIKAGLMNNIMSVLFTIMKTPPLDDDEEQYFSPDSSEDTLLTCACETLDAIALNADPKKLIPSIMEMVRPLLESTVPYDRKGAYLILGIVSQGCGNLIKNSYLESYVTTVLKGVNDSNAVVRNAALFAMGQMAEYLQPEISTKAMEVMPLLINQLDRLLEEGKGGSRMGQRVDRLFYAVERFTETLESAIKFFLADLIPRLLVLSAPPFHAHVRELAIPNLGSAAGSAQEAILPYFMDIMNVLNMYLNPQIEPENTPLQVEALDTLGILARTVGPNEFRPLALDSIKLGLELVASTNDPDVRKSSYTLFGSVSKVLKEEMSPLLENIILPLLASIKDQDAFIVHNRDDADVAFPLYDSDPDEGNEDEEDDMDDIISVENDYVEEKEEACLALKELALNTGEGFTPYLEQSIEEVYKLLIFPSTDVRQAALEAEAQFCISFVKIMLSASHGDNKLVVTVMEKLIGKTIEMIKTDLSREVVVTGLECLQTMLREIGPQIGSLESVKKAIVDVTKEVLNCKTESQSLSESGEDDITETELIDAAADVIPLFAKAMSQKEFSEVFALFLPLIRNKIIEGADDEDSDDEEEEEGSRANMIGVLAECMEGLGPLLGPYISGLLPYLLGLSKDADANVRNNSLYAIGEMALHGKEQMFPQYLTLLNALSQVLSSETKPKVLDNACGVIARMIISNIQAIPLEEVFPVFINQLPLKDDYSEDIWVTKAIAHVAEVAPDMLRPQFFAILQSTAFALDTHSPDDECKETLINAFRLFVTRFPQECQEMLPRLPGKLIETLHEAGIV